MQTSEFTSACGCCGVGFHVTDEGRAQECACSYRRRKERFLGGNFFLANRLKQSPLLERAVDRHTLTRDRTGENLWLTSEWTELAAHLRFVLGVKWHLTEAGADPFRFRVVTDDQLRVAFLGDRDAEVEAVSSLMSAAFHLVVLRVGFLGWSNKAMSGYLKSALMHRCEVVRRAVWFVDEPREPFSKGHLAWSDETEAYVRGRFERVALGGP